MAKIIVQKQFFLTAMGIISHWENGNDFIWENTNKKNFIKKYLK
jgi:hypothetical protein